MQNGTNPWKAIWQYLSKITYAFAFCTIYPTCKNLHQRNIGRSRKGCLYKTTNRNTTYINEELKATQMSVTRGLVKWIMEFIIIKIHNRWPSNYEKEWEIFLHSIVSWSPKHIIKWGKKVQNTMYSTFHFIWERGDYLIIHTIPYIFLKCKITKINNGFL